MNIWTWFEIDGKVGQMILIHLPQLLVKAPM
jgi:hypothetical protein